MPDPTPTEPDGGTVDLASGETIAITREPSASPQAEPDALETVGPERYAVGNEVARGGMGRILKAEDLRLRRSVALKELHGDTGALDRRFVREALVTARLQHPAIVPIYEAGRWPSGVPFYAMKLVRGRAFDTVIHRARTLGERIALLPHVIAVAEAVAYAHGERIVHRDLKPANVLVGAFGETVVVDWGLAKDLSRAAPDEQSAHADSVGSTAEKTIVGTVLGTPHYMPPEQARGEDVDERADVYALGAMLYFLLAGRPPHAGKTAAETLKAVIAGPPAPIAEVEPEVPEELATIVSKAMAADKALRYPTALEFSADLKRFQTGQLVSVHRYSTLDLWKRWLHKHRAAVTVAAVLTAGLLASLIAGVVGIRREATRAALERDKARLEARKAQQINAFVRGMLGSADPRADGKAVTVAQVLDGAAQRAETELADQPEVQAAVQMTLGSTYQGLGLFQPAAKELQAALETRRRLLGPDHADVAVSLTAVGALADADGDPNRAANLLKEALAMQERLGLADAADAIDTRSRLADAYEKLGDYAEAERIERDVLARQRKLHGEQSQAVATTLNDIAVVLGQKGDWAGSASLLREALGIERKLKGEHPDTAVALTNLASALEAQGDFVAAEAAFQEGLAMRRKLLGDEHPAVAYTLYNYAYMLRHKGDLAGAVARSREALSSRGKTLSDSHPVVAATLQVLGRSLAEMGQAGAAEKVLRESLELRRRALPPGNWMLGSSESVLAECLVRLSRHAEAEPLALQGYEKLRAAKGEDHEQVKEARQRLVALYEAWKKPEQAARYRPTSQP